MQGGAKTAYILVGALTWTVPKGSPLKEDEVGDLEEGAPVIDTTPEEEEEEEEEEEVIPIEDQPEDQEPQVQGVHDDSEEEGGVEEPKAPEGEAEAQDEKKKDEIEEENKSEKPEEKVQEWETRVFRLATPMYSEKAKEVTRVVMDMLLRLRADEYHIGHIHSDQGHEFQGQFKVWCRERGIHLTRTPGDDPRSNGRAEATVKAIKTQVRRTLLQAEADAT